MTRSRQTADWGSRAGLAKVIPSSVAVGSGTGSADTTGKVTFSGVSSLSLNDVFSATYQNYLIVSTMISTNDTDVWFRWRVSGSDNSTSNYSWGQAGVFATATTFGYGNENNSTRFRFVTSNAANSQKFSMHTFYNPFVTDTSGYTGNLAYSSGTANYFAGSIGGGFNGTTSFTGFTIYTGAGTITGNLTVYGYN